MEESLSRVRDSIFPSTSAILVLLVFFCQDFVVRAAGHFFVQYVSKRFHWTLAEAGYLLSVRGFTSIFVLLIGLPALGALLTSSYVPMRVSLGMKNLVLARISSLAMTLGALLMGAGDIVPVTVVGQVIMTLGDGLIPLCKTILASYVEADRFSTVYTMVSLVETVGGLLSGPALAGLFSKGMGLGGLWLGLPYFGLALICMWAFTLLLFAKPARHVRSEGEAEVTESRQDDQQ
jgi:MFS family permease